MFRPKEQIPGIYHRKIGEIVVTAISDGFLDVPLGIVRNITEDEAEQVLIAENRPSIPRVSVNCFVVHSKGRCALIETGSGNTMGPTLGWLPRNLQAAGIDPQKIEAVLLTHMHPDHSNGLTDNAGTSQFNNAELIVHEDEVNHWLDDACMSRANERQKRRYFQGARQQLVPYYNRLRKFRDGEVFPGVKAIPIPGHTPGHTAFLISSGPDSLLVWGDTVHVPDIQVPRPEVTMEFDSDPSAAAKMRTRVFDMAVTERLLIAGMHLHFPGFARMIHDGNRYRLVTEPWAFHI